MCINKVSSNYVSSDLFLITKFVGTVGDKYHQAIGSLEHDICFHTVVCSVIRITKDVSRLPKLLFMKKCVHV